jgi:hypothetical protein
MTAVDSCLWCYGTGYVHTNGGKLGDLISGPGICDHEGHWRVLTDAEVAHPKHVAALARLHAQAATANRAADTRDFTAPQHDRNEA